MKTTALLLALLMTPGFAGASEFHSRALSTNDRAVLSTPGYAARHPDYRFRSDGLRAYDSGRFDEAMTAFRRSARYADKMSQAMIGQMLWNGDGIARDRSAAYAWMDLAAERGYPMMLGIRERYWSGMEEDERTRALDIGEALYAEFGDKVAKRRLERELRKGLMVKTGTRVGADIDVRVFSTMSDRHGNGRESPVNANGEFDVAGFYNNKYWKPKQYWAWQDEVHGAMPARGRVIVRDITVQHEARFRLRSPDRD